MFRWMVFQENGVKEQRVSQRRAMCEKEKNCNIKTILYVHPTLTFISTSFGYHRFYLVTLDPPFPFVTDSLGYAQTIKWL